MKKYILLILLSILCKTNFSQSYKSIFGSDTTSWNLYVCTIDFSTFAIMRAYGDTIVDSIMYKKLYYGYGDIGSEELAGLIREDTNLGLTFERDLLDHEIVLMDLNLDPGDTCYIPTSIVASEFTAITVAAIYTEDNDTHIIINDYQCGGFPNKTELIEGIGPTYGFAGLGYPLDSSVRMSVLCKYYNDSLVYKNPAFPDYNCQGQTTSLTTQQKLQFNISPNPVTENITIEILNAYKLEVLNVTGQTVMDVVWNGSFANIQITHLTKGIYYARVSTNDGAYYYSKFVKT